MLCIDSCLCLCLCLCGDVQVQLCTTSGGNVRFNPNLYQQGTVCLSLLGTWGGPSW